MLKNEKLAYQILESIDILLEASGELYRSWSENEKIIARKIVLDMEELINALYDSVCIIKKEADYLNTDKACRSIQYSLNRISKMIYWDDTRVIDKLEFELVPLLQDMKLQFYYWAIVDGDQEKIKKYYEYEMIPLVHNEYIDLAEQEGNYKYDLSILITAYNKLEYTKKCIESLMKYLPEDKKCELILVNHGSTDGTQEYFEGLIKTKQFDILENGGGIGAISRIIEGKYALLVSNDILVTENAINNMIQCMESDPDIAYVVPTTPNVSNMQSINAAFSNEEEMYEFARKNNICNSRRWEQRNRLCNPIAMYRTSQCWSSQGVNDIGYFMALDAYVFPDDRLSLLLRRKKYKMVLAKDAFCYHFGSVTIRDEMQEKVKINQENYYLRGRKAFYGMFGVDPWGTGCCYDSRLFLEVQVNNRKKTNILGINCGMGANSLKIKEELKEKCGNTDVLLYNITSDKTYIDDLRGISDYAQFIPNIYDCDEIIKNLKFGYIIIEESDKDQDELIILLTKLMTRLEEKGSLFVKIPLISEKILGIKGFAKQIPSFNDRGSWLIFQK